MIYESQHFRLEADDRVLTLWLDFRGRRANTFTLPILHELNLVFDRVATLPAPDVFLLRSGRTGTYLEEFASADLARFTSPLEFAALSRRGQEAGRKLAALPFPTVAIIEGRCAGTGLELALACDYRWAIANLQTRIEFAETERGLIPSWGGTVRLPRLIGRRAALRLLAGGQLGAACALRAGLIDQVLQPAEATVRLLTLVDQLRDQSGKRRQPIWRSVRQWIDRMVSQTLVPRVGSTTALDDEADPRTELRGLVGFGSEGEGLAAERAAFTRQAAHESTRRRLELHRFAVGPVRVFPEPANPVPLAPHRVAIVGGGDLGSRLACRFARTGHVVVVQEENSATADRASQRLAARAAELCGRGVMDLAEARQLSQAVRITTAWVGFENADLVVESAAEDVGVKRNLFHEMERRVRPRVPLVTASTTIPIEAIQAEMNRPGRIAGLHLSNPEAKRPVAELVGAASTDPGLLAALGQWSVAWGFVPVRVADRPGRLVELVKLTYLSEGVALVAEGLPINAVDAGCRRFGFERGPLEWCDEIGLDRLAESVAQLRLARGDGFARNLLFQRLIPLGCLGREIGEGFYRYGFVRRPSETARMVVWQDFDEDASSTYAFDPALALRTGIDRVVLRTINEAATALADEPDSDPAAVDIALAFGMGWAPSRGGPLRWADKLGLSTVVERLATYAEQVGPRYSPCDELVRRAEAGETFYGAASVDAIMPATSWRVAG